MLLDLSEAVRYNHSRGDAGNTGDCPMGGYKSDPKADSGSNHLEKKETPAASQPLRFWTPILQNRPCAALHLSRLPNSVSHNTMLPHRHQHFGPLLCGLVKHGPVKIEKASAKAGHFHMGGRRLLAKYASASSSAWGFTFRPEDVRTLVADHASAGFFSYLCLICGSDFICVLRSDEAFDLLSTDVRQKSQTIRVRRSYGCCLRVSGSEGQLDRTVPANRFPSFLAKN